MDRLAEAERLFLEALALQEKGDLDSAKSLYQEALALAPERPSVMNNLAAVLIRLGKCADAKLLCETLLAIDPENEAALVNLGNCQLGLGAAGDALLSIDRALQFDPASPQALVSRCGALLELERPQEALASCDRALALKPDYAEAFHKRGIVLMKLERVEEAVASYERVLALAPESAEVLYNHGTGLLELHRFQEALVSLDRALRINPDHVQALNNRGYALFQLGRSEDALGSFDRALAIKPDYADALGNRSDALLRLNRHEELIECYRRMLELKPDYDYVPGYLLRARMQICEWTDYQGSVARISEDIRAGRRADTPFGFLGISESAADQLSCSRLFVADRCPATREPVWRGERYRHEKVRVAYLSADFRDHALARLIAGLIEAHDRTRFEITAISFGPDSNDRMRLRLKNAFDRFIDASNRTDREVALQLRALETDIAVDLQGFSRFSRPRILAQRPAPVQVNYLGYPGTMGAPYIDYIVADRWVIPRDHHPFYAERVVYLPDCFQVNDRERKVAADTPSRAELGLPETAFVFCCFNNNYKITLPLFDLWMRLLKQVEGSVLWLLADNRTVVRNLRQEAEKRGVAPERVVFAPRVELEKHLARQRAADLFLDTLPCNAHTTASDALWVGLPVVTHVGSTFAGRVAASLLHAVGLAELITTRWTDYEALALKLATDGRLLGEIKARLDHNRLTSPLFDTDRLRRNIEAAYVAMWERSQRGDPPASFGVPEVA